MQAKIHKEFVSTKSSQEPEAGVITDKGFTQNNRKLKTV
jgi:hypothetical protein